MKALCTVLLLAVVTPVLSWAPLPYQRLHTTTRASPLVPSITRSAVQSPEKAVSSSKTTTTTAPATTNPDETTKKFGLEVGLFESLKQKDGGESAKSLLKRYGIAYLATSIPLAAISFVICYLLVDHGVDVAGLLAQVGIQNDATEKAGTLAIAYAAHKAASPIRFPPTVILTPLVAKLIGKEPENDDDKTATASS